MAKSYDENLLAAAPVATKAELQEGYNVDILSPNRPATTAPAPAPLAPPAASATVLENGSRTASREKLGAYAPPVPWWRTAKGAVIIAVVVLVVIGAVVGAAVGATRHHSQSNTNLVAGASSTTVNPTTTTNIQPNSTAAPASSSGASQNAPNSTAAPTSSSGASQNAPNSTAAPTSSSGAQQNAPNPTTSH